MKRYIIVVIVISVFISSCAVKGKIWEEDGVIKAEGNAPMDIKAKTKDWEATFDMRGRPLIEIPALEVER